MDDNLAQILWTKVKNYLKIKERNIDADNLEIPYHDPLIIIIIRRRKIKIKLFIHNNKSCCCTYFFNCNIHDIRMKLAHLLSIRVHDEIRRRY